MYFSHAFAVLIKIATVGKASEKSPFKAAFTLIPSKSSMKMSDDSNSLMYSFLFLSGSSMTIVLIPITTYALLHSCSFLAQILTNYPSIKQLLDRVTENHSNLLRFVALNEIVLMPILILSIFVARSNLLLIFMYYRFLTLRYSSHRNPYTRTLFGELKASVEYLCNKPACPAIVRRICYSSISFINRLAPVST